MDVVAEHTLGILFLSRLFQESNKFTFQQSLDSVL